MTVRGRAGDAQIGAASLPLRQRAEHADKLLPIVDGVNIGQGERKIGVLSLVVLELHQGTLGLLIYFECALLPHLWRNNDEEPAICFRHIEPEASREWKPLL